MQLVQSQSFTAQTGHTLSFRLLLKIAMTLRRTSQQNRQTRGCDLYASLSLPKSPLTHRSGCKWQRSACTWSDGTFSLKSLGRRQRLHSVYTQTKHNLPRKWERKGERERERDQFDSAERWDWFVMKFQAKPIYSPTPGEEYSILIGLSSKQGQCMASAD